jgi:hypothetical protein
MVINYALMGSDMNPLYLDFWPILSKVWKEVFNITPVLGLISDEETDIYDDGNGLVIKLKSIEGFDDGLLSQLVRLYLPKFLEGNCIISDIDMIPLSKKYFIDDLNDYSDNEFIIMSSHHPQTININQYPMCYVVGNDKVFKELFTLEDDWISFVKKIPLQGWFTDQLYLYDVINSNTNFNYKFPQRNGGFTDNRIDREMWRYDVNKLKEGYYIDSHSLRPYSQYSEEINKLIKYINL